MYEYQEIGETYSTLLNVVVEAQNAVKFSEKMLEKKYDEKLSGDLKKKEIWRLEDEKTRMKSKRFDSKSFDIYRKIFSQRLNDSEHMECASEDDEVYRDRYMMLYVLFYIFTNDTSDSQRFLFCNSAIIQYLEDEMCESGESILSCTLSLGEFLNASKHYFEEVAEKFIDMSLKRYELTN